MYWGIIPSNSEGLSYSAPCFNCVCVHLRLPLLPKWEALLTAVNLQAILRIKGEIDYSEFAYSLQMPKPSLPDRLLLSMIRDEIIIIFNFSLLNWDEICYFTLYMKYHTLKHIKISLTQYILPNPMNGYGHLNE